MTALELHERVGSPLLVAYTDAERASLLADRGKGNDDLRARPMAQRALSAAATTGGRGPVERDALAVLGRLAQPGPFRARIPGMGSETHLIQIDNHGNGRMTVHDIHRGAMDIREEDLRAYLQEYNDDRFSISISHAGVRLPGSEYPREVLVTISRWAPDR